VAVAGLTRACGPWHRDTLTTSVQHALALRRLGRLQEAESELSQAMRALPLILGQDHADAHRSRAWHAVLLHDLGRLDEARAELSAAVAALARLLGADHPLTTTIRSDRAASA
jgi:tetratricopeptide (TPR) repeat protein